MAKLAATLLVAATTGTGATLTAARGDADLGIRPMPLTQPVPTRHGNVGTRIPPVLFGRHDGLPHHLTAGSRYLAHVMVWVGADGPDAAARLDRRAAVRLPAGMTSVLDATVSAAPTLLVRVRVGSRTFTHRYHHVVGGG